MILRAVNLPNHQSAHYSIYANANKKITSLGLNVGTNLSTNGNVYYSFINNALNKTNSYTYSGQLSLSKYKEKKYQIYLNLGPNYTVGQSSLQPNINNNGRGFNGDYYINFYLPGKIQISSDGQYQFKAATQSFNSDFKQTIINASLTKAFFKAENLKIVLRGNDLLNQNSGFTRSASSNLITEERYTTIRRYYMLSVVWDFNGTNSGPPAKK